MREVAAEFRNPVMLYSIGKDSSVMLHLARKAFYPAKPPFPLLHVDTTWKFREMIAFRDETARELGLELIVHINQEGLARGINPIASGSALHTQVMKTEALKQALDKWRLRCRLRRRAARRGEEPRQGAHLLASARAEPRLGPAQPAARTVEALQHPHRAGRVDARLPAVELDRARHLGIHRAPRTFRSCRSISPSRARWWSATARLIMVDDDRLPLQPGETPRDAHGALPHARLLSADRRDRVRAPTRSTRSSPRCAPRARSERQGRLIDNDEAASMEKKKREGYF